MEFAAFRTAFDDVESARAQDKKVLQKISEQFLGGGQSVQSRLPVLLQGIQGREYGIPEKQFLDKANSEFAARISRNERGNHTVEITLFDFDESPIAEGQFETTIYEGQLKEIATLVDEWGARTRGYLFSET